MKPTACSVRYVWRNNMHYQSTRKFARILHLAIAAFQFVYIYTPLHTWEHGLSLVQWVTFPLLVISGLWLWKGHKLWLLGKDMQIPTASVVSPSHMPAHTR